MAGWVLGVRGGDGLRVSLEGEMSKAVKQRKAEQRKRDRENGWVEVSVKVSVNEVDKLRSFAATLPPPPSDYAIRNQLVKTARAILAHFGESAA